MRFETYAEEMKRKFPDRPYKTRPSWELHNMRRALSLMPWLNTPEERRRLVQVEKEIKARAHDARRAVAS